MKIKALFTSLLTIFALIMGQISFGMQMAVGQIDSSYKQRRSDDKQDIGKLLSFTINNECSQGHISDMVNVEELCDWVANNTVDTTYDYSKMKSYMLIAKKYNPETDLSSIEKLSPYHQNMIARSKVGNLIDYIDTHPKLLASFKTPCDGSDPLIKKVRLSSDGKIAVIEFFYDEVEIWDVETNQRKCFSDTSKADFLKAFSSDSSKGTRAQRFMNGTVEISINNTAARKKFFDELTIAQAVFLNDKVKPGKIVELKTDSEEYKIFMSFSSKAREYLESHFAIVSNICSLDFLNSTLLKGKLFYLWFKTRALFFQLLSRE